MGSSQCCSQNLDNAQSELVLKIEDTEKSSRKSSKRSPIKESQAPTQKEKLARNNKCEEPSTPAFAELRSVGSRKSDQSNKDIELVAEIVMNLDEKMDEIIQQSPVASMRSLRSQNSKKNKKDSPICEFQPKNSLKSFDSKKLTKLKSLSEHRVKFEDEMKGDAESQKSMSVDNRSQKSILKQELKYSQFRKQRTTQNDTESKKKVHFNIKK